MKRKARRQTLKGLLVLIGSALVVALCAWQWDALMGLLSDEPGVGQVKGGKGGGAAVKVITEAVTLTSDAEVFEAIGTGRARLSVEIFPQVAENVTEVHFKGGDRVSKGDPLVQLDAREERLAVRLARVRLSDARARLSDLQGAAKKGAVPRVQLEGARLAAQTAQIELERAQLALSERTVRAPFSGVVGVASVDPGDRVTHQTRLTSLDDRQEMFIDFAIPEALAGRLLQAGAQTIEATTPAWPKRRFEGTVDVQGSRVDAAQRTLMVRARVENKEDLLRPGMSFATRWATDGQERPTIPEIALQWGRAGSFVWVVRDGEAAQVSVRVVSRAAGRILVEGELQVGEPVVVEGLQRLRPGVAVEVLGSRS